MPRYTKNPVTIEARQIGDVLDRIKSGGLVESWVEDAIANGDVVITSDPEGLKIMTLEGEMFGARTWWLIRGVEGEVYPCKPEIFDVSYHLDEGMESEEDHTRRMVKMAGEVAEWSKGLNKRLSGMSRLVEDGSYDDGSIDSHGGN